MKTEFGIFAIAGVVILLIVAMALLFTGPLAPKFPEPIKRKPVNHTITIVLEKDYHKGDTLVIIGKHY
jgi:hypothetical protein